MLFLVLLTLTSGFPLALLMIELFYFLKLKITLPRPTQLPLKNLSGTIILNQLDWARHARDLYPIRFFVFEILPSYLRSKYRSSIK